MQTDNLNSLIACPHCDTLHQHKPIAPRSTAQCCNCGAVLITSRPNAIVRVIALALASFILMIAAISFPFLDLDAQGFHKGASVLDAVFAFDDGLSIPLAIGIAFFIIILPLARLMALIYALAPLIAGSAPWRQGRAAFAFAEWLRPWAMAEIFMVGVAVALIKVTQLATVTFGPAFWAFVAVVLISAFKDQFMCRYSIWEALDHSE